MRKYSACSQTPIVRNRRKGTRSEGGYTSCRKKRKRRQTKSEIERKRKNIYGTIKKSMKKETANRTGREVQVVAGREKKQTVSWRRGREERKSGMGTGTGREGAGRRNRMREVERRSNFLTRRLVAA